MFLRNCWYAAAWDDEVAEIPLARTVLGEPVVLWRSADGRPAALEDRCCHRGLPLSMGRPVGETLQCGYHGLRFDTAGRCVAVPGQSAIPPGARVRAFPLVERHGWVWIWMGDAAAADPSLVPDWWWMDHPGWRPVRVARPSMSRRATCCSTTICSTSRMSPMCTRARSARQRSPTSRSRPGAARIRPHVADGGRFPGAAALCRDGRFDGNVDRWQVAVSTLPAYNTVHAGCAPPGAGGADAPQGAKVEFFNLNAMTPETETTTHYFYAHARSFALDDRAVDESFRVDFRRVFGEDISILGAQQANIARRPGAASIDINVDGPGLAFPACSPGGSRPRPGPGGGNEAQDGLAAAAAMGLVVLAVGSRAEDKIPVAWESGESAARLSRSAHKTDFFPLSNNYVSQDNKIFCGPTSSAIVLNALRLGRREGLPEDRQSIARDRARLAAQRSQPVLRQVHRAQRPQRADQEEDRGARQADRDRGGLRRDYGLQLRQLARVLRVHGLDVAVRVVDRKADGEAIRREIARNLATGDDYVLVNYARKALGQQGGGHISPARGV